MEGGRACCARCNTGWLTVPASSLLIGLGGLPNASRHLTTFLVPQDGEPLVSVSYRFCRFDARSLSRMLLMISLPSVLIRSSSESWTSTALSHRQRKLGHASPPLSDSSLTVVRMQVCGERIHQDPCKPCCKLSTRQPLVARYATQI